MMVVKKVQNRVGEIYISKDGTSSKIIKYVCSDDVDILFSDGTIVKNMQYSKFVKGQVKNKNKPNVYGVGYLGFGAYNAIKDKKAYKVWNSMIERGYSCLTKNKQPSYLNCSVHPDWHNFQNFAKWFEKNYIEGFYLDKDILIKNNNVYSADNCCFVPRIINNSVSSRKNHRTSEYPGVIKKNNVFYVQISIDGKTFHLGVFKLETEAFNAYKEAKEKNIKKNANLYKGIISNRCYDALINWKVEKND